MGEGGGINQPKSVTYELNGSQPVSLIDLQIQHNLRHYRKQSRILWVVQMPAILISKFTKVSRLSIPSVMFSSKGMANLMNKGTKCCCWFPRYNSHRSFDVKAMEKCNPSFCGFPIIHHQNGQVCTLEDVLSWKFQFCFLLFVFVVYLFHWFNNWIKICIIIW